MSENSKKKQPDDSTVETVLPVSPLEPNSPVPVSLSQQRFWMLYLLEGDKATYHCTKGISLTGNLDKKTLAIALKNISLKHSALRCCIKEILNNPYQNIFEDFTNFLPLSGLTKPVALKNTTDITTYIKKQHEEPFTLTTPPLWRISLITQSPNNHLLIITTHRIIADEISTNLILSDLGDEYTALKNN